MRYVARSEGAPTNRSAKAPNIGEPSQVCDRAAGLSLAFLGPIAANRLRYPRSIDAGLAMVWSIQSPNTAGPKLIDAINGAAEGNAAGGAAFAFVSAMGVKLLAAAPAFAACLETGTFELIVGMDAITDTNAIGELTALTERYSGLSVWCFLHTTAACFHPKTVWFDDASTGTLITGSGNLTIGGLRQNWEAFDIRGLQKAELTALKSEWAAWKAVNANNLLPLDDARVTERASANKVKRSKIVNALKPSINVDEDLGVEELIEEAEAQADLTSVLVAEVPRSGGRWNQVNFNLATYQNFFGVTLGTERHVTFYNVNADGSLGASEDRQAVSVASKNYRFEVGAASGLDYPSEGNPILVFEKVSENVFKYVLLMPESEAHSSMQQFIDANYVRKREKIRALITRAILREIWPLAPFFT